MKSFAQLLISFQPEQYFLHTLESPLAKHKVSSTPKLLLNAIYPPIS